MAESHLEIFRTLISRIADGNTVLADLTYGPKCLAVILMMSMNYGYHACKDCAIECIVYGSLDFRDGHPCGRRIFDITPLFLMDQIVNEFAKSGSKNPMKMIESIRLREQIWLALWEMCVLSFLRPGQSVDTGNFLCRTSMTQGKRNF